MNYPQRIFNAVLDAVFPIRCLGCSVFGSYFCDTCLTSLKPRKDFECIGCKRPVPKGQTCAGCREVFKIDRLFVASDYNDPLIKNSLKMFKYGFIPDLAGPLSELARYYIEGVAKEWEFKIFSGKPLIIPIPLHRRRLNWRGFNQSELLAEKLAGIYASEYRPDVLTRKTYNRPQADMESKEERTKNLNNTFECSGAVAERDVIIDDICTTGTTLNESAKVLLSAGAKSVSALVVARG